MRIGEVASSMGWLEWTASIVGSIAWPVAAVIIAAFFRSQITNLLKKVRKLSWGDASVDFAEKLDEIESASRVAEAEATSAPKAPTTLPDERFTQLLQISPSAAVLDAWGAIETRLRTIATDLAPSASTYMPRQMILLLFKRGVIPSAMREILLELSSLRNAAAHQREVSVTDAIRFREFALRAAAELDAAVKHSPALNPAPPTTPPAT